MIIIVIVNNLVYSFNSNLCRPGSLFLVPYPIGQLIISVVFYCLNTNQMSERAVFKQLMCALKCVNVILVCANAAHS